MLAPFVFLAIGFLSLTFLAWSLARINQLEDPFEAGAVSATPEMSAEGGLHFGMEVDRTIFVVDDDPGLLNLVAEVLKLHGFQVKGFTDPVLALAEFRSHHGTDDLLVTDYRMKPMTGLELIANCRVESPGLRSVVISGATEEAERAGVPRGSDRFLAKPFAVKDLVESIESTLAAGRN